MGYSPPHRNPAILPKPVTGEFLVAHPHTGTGSSNAWTGDRMVLARVPVSLPTAVDQLAFYVATVGAGSGQVGRIGYYADDGSGLRPTGAAISQSAIDVVGSTGQKSLSLSTTLAGGFWWVAFALQGTLTTKATLTTSGATGVTPVGTLQNSITQKFYRLDSVSGAFPTISSATALAYTDIIPAMGFRVA